MSTGLQVPGAESSQRTPPASPAPRSVGLAQQVLAISALTLLGWGTVAATVGLVDARVWSEATHSPLLVTVSVLVALTTGAICWSVSRARSYAACLIVAATSTTLSGLATAALHGTRWSYNGLYSDAAFRTEAVTRFADSPALSDYAYRALPTYYPPALPWVQGRVADLVGLPGWAAMKPVTLVLAAVVPVLAYLMWRRVVPDLTAALVVAATSLTTADLVKPDEWLVLALVVPWWLHVVRDVRVAGAARMRWWQAGLVLGGLLLCHTFYFAPLALATVVAALTDVVRRRQMPLRPGRGIAVAAVGLLVASPYWLPMVVLRLRAAPSDSLQLQWSEVGFTWPPWPLPVSVVGTMGLVGVVWAVLRARSSPLALGLLTTLASAYALMLGGQVLQRWGVTVLPEKAEPLIVALLVTTGVLCLVDLWRSTAGLSLRVPDVVTAAATIGLAVLLVLGSADRWLVGSPAQAAQRMRYPDGSHPAGGWFEGPSHRHPWSVSPQPTGPSVEEVRSAWRRVTGRDLDDRSVVVTSRADLLATTPIHPFLTWKSIYSHPAGRFEDRLRLLERVGSCTTPQCAWRLLRHNDLDRVDGLVLAVTSEGLRLTVTTDTFPDAWTTRPIIFDPALLTAPYFRRADVRGVAVVEVVADPGR